MSSLYGGMALPGGVMMRGPRHWAAVVRKPDGTNETKTGEVGSVLASPFAARPFVRAFALLFEAYRLGIPLSLWAAQVNRLGRVSEAFSKRALLVTCLASAVFTVSLVFLLPAFIASLFHLHGGWAALVEDVAKLVLVTGYLAGIKLIPDVRRLYGYHGAEHKAINALETGEPVTLATARKASRFHPRCGTSFLVMVVILSMATSFLGHWHLLLIPVVISLSYEATRWLSKRTSPAVKVVTRFLMGAQWLTTSEPNDIQLQAAIDALRLAQDGPALALLEMSA